MSQSKNNRSSEDERVAKQAILLTAVLTGSTVAAIYHGLVMIGTLTAAFAAVTALYTIRMYIYICAVEIEKLIKNKQ